MGCLRSTLVSFVDAWWSATIPTICVSAAESITIEHCGDNNVHWRTLISAVLILVLLSLSSAAPVCDVQCRTSGMPGMKMNSGSPHVGSAAQHHHQITPDSDDPDAGSIAPVSQLLFAKNACCVGLLPTLTIPCVKPQNNTFEKQFVAPKWNPDSGRVQNQLAGLSLFQESLNPDSTTPAAVPPVVSHSLTLRI
jgi:hypothetical protein